MGRPTIKTIAQATGFSVGTVSQALRSAESVNADTRKRILKAAQDVGYVANRDARKLRTSKSLKIAAFLRTPDSDIAEFEGVEFTRTIAGVAQTLTGSPYELSLYPSNNLDEEMALLRRIAELNEADGVIFDGTLANDPRIEFLQDRDLPFVTLGMSTSSVPHAFVDIDSEAAAYEASARLIRLGHQRIAQIDPPEVLYYARQRAEGYSKALNDAGVAVDTRLMVNGPISPAAGKSSYERLSQLPNPPSAYVCANEALALGVLSAISVSKPKDFRPVVISMDDFRLSGYFQPPPTTYFVPIGETSRLLGEYMLKLLNGAAPETLQTKIKPVLIERQADTLVNKNTPSPNT